MEFREFKAIPAAALVQQRRRSLRVGALMLTAAIAGGAVRAQDMGLAGHVLFVCLVSAVIVIAILRGNHHQKKFWDAFRIFLDDESITRRMPGFADLELRRDQVREVHELEGSGLTVMGEKHPHLFVPVHVDGYAAIRSVLASWRPITIQEPASTRHRILVMLAIIGVPLAFWLSMYSNDARVVVPAGCISVVAFTAAEIIVLRSPYVVRWVKAYMLFNLTMLFALAYRVWTFL